MAHLTISLPDDIEQRARALAETDGISMDEWITARVVDLVKKSWSPAFLAAAGADPDLPEIEDDPFVTRLNDSRT